MGIFRKDDKQLIKLRIPFLDFDSFVSPSDPTVISCHLIKTISLNGYSIWAIDGSNVRYDIVEDKIKDLYLETPGFVNHVDIVLAKPLIIDEFSKEYRDFVR